MERVTSIIWDRSDWESSAIDMDTDEEVGFVHFEVAKPPFRPAWKAEVQGCMLNEEFGSQRAAEIAVEQALEQEDILN
jgi:hypothetical protein